MASRITSNSDSFEESLPAFGKASFLACKSDQYGWFTNGRLVLPFIIDRRLIFKRLILMSNIVELHEGITKNDLQDFINEVSMLAKKELKVDFISNPLASATFSVFPQNSISSKYWTFAVDLSRTEEGIFSNFNSTTRNQIRSGGRKNFSVEKTDDINLFMELLETTYNRSNEAMLTPSRKFINDMLRKLVGHIALYKVIVNNETQAMALVVYDKERAYYYYGASINRPMRGSVPFLHWDIIQRMKKKGIKYYDLMGVIANAPNDSKDHGLMSFKSRYGGVLEEGIIFKVIYSPFKYRLFNIAVRFAYRLKGGRYQGDVIDKVLLNDKNKAFSELSTPSINYKTTKNEGGGL